MATRVASGALMGMDVHCALHARVGGAGAVAAASYVTAGAGGSTDTVATSMAGSIVHQHRRHGLQRGKGRRPVE